MPLETFITHYSACRRDKRDSLQQDPTHVLPSHHKHPKVVGDKGRSPKIQIQPHCREIF